MAEYPTSSSSNKRKCRSSCKKNVRKISIATTKTMNMAAKHREGELRSPSDTY